jgi:hypothetical protein
MLEPLHMTEPLIKSLNRVAHLKLTSSLGTLNEGFQFYQAYLLP